MRRIVLLGLIIFIALANALSANDKYVIYTQTFPWIGPDGEAPEVVFADLIEKERLIAVYSHDFHVFWFDPFNGWQNEGGQIRNDWEYTIKILRDVPNKPNNHFVQVNPTWKPTTIIVDINGIGDYTTIQEGIDNSLNGDTVLVYPGTYYENINYNGKNITVASLYITTLGDSFIHRTIIDGNQNGSVVTFENGEDTTAVLCGYTIENGSGKPYGSSSRGGGIFCDNSHPNVRNCIISRNRAGSGGGIYCKTSIVCLSDVNIKNNSAQYNGGGIYFWDNASAIFNNDHRCSIFLNYAGIGCDIRSIDCNTMDIVLDTFTVSVPDDYFVYPMDSFTFDILNYKIEPVNHDLYVSPVGNNNNSGLTYSDPLKNISFALSKIKPDNTNPNTIHLENGTYSSSLTDEVFPLNCRSYVSIIGEDEDNTILDGGDLSNILTFVWNDDHINVENLTIQNGNSYSGGGIYIGYDSSPIFKNITLKDNLAEIGSSIICLDNCSPIFENVKIFGDPSVLLQDEPVSIYENSDPVFVNCVIRDNVIDPEGTGAGAMGFTAQSNPVLINTQIINNTDSQTSGIHIYNGSSDEGPTLINCTICDNSDCSEGTIRQLWNTNLTIINCILRNNSQKEICFLSNGDPNSVTISYTNIKDSINGINTNNNGTIIWGEGNIDEDPLFVGGDPYSYELSKNSPCVDAGTPDTTGLHLPATDLAGNQRIFNGRIDIGAYEYQGYGVDEPDTSFIHNLYLFQNKPNPFKESTTISFISADYERIKEYTLSIYNTKGQLVRRYEGNKDDFWVRTEIVWDGTDGQGRQVAPGTYLYKLEYNGHAVVRKMVMLTLN